MAARLHRVRPSLGVKFMEPRRHAYTPAGIFVFRPSSPKPSSHERIWLPLSPGDNIICRGARTRAHGPPATKMRCTDVSGQAGNRSAMAARVRRRNTDEDGSTIFASFCRSLYGRSLIFWNVSSIFPNFHSYVLF